MNAPIFEEEATIYFPLLTGKDNLKEAIL